jgi:hypothetical protein
MANISLTDEQVIDLFKQLSPERKRAILLTLAEGTQSRRDERMKYAESQLKRLCKEKELDWDLLSEEEKEFFIDDLIHEDR